MDAYIKPIKDDDKLADGIALTRALKENIFAIIVGIECNIPVTCSSSVTGIGVEVW